MARVFLPESEHCHFISAMFYGRLLILNAPSYNEALSFFFVFNGNCMWLFYVIGLKNFVLDIMAFERLNSPHVIPYNFCFSVCSP